MNLFISRARFARQMTRNNKHHTISFSLEDDRQNEASNASDADSQCEQKKIRQKHSYRVAEFKVFVLLTEDDVQIQRIPSTGSLASRGHIVFREL